MPKPRTIKLPPVEFIRRCFRVDESTGQIYRLERPRSDFSSNRAWHAHMLAAGKVAGRTRRDGYVELPVTFDGRNQLVMAHWVVWGLTFGAWPSQEIDHRNRVKCDNRPDNLRNASRQQNCANAGPRTTNLLGLKGVSRDRKNTRRPFRARIKVGDKDMCVGWFETAEQAAEAVKGAHRRIHGDFAFDRGVES